jgi:hypothetical protein
MQIKFSNFTNKNDALIAVQDFGTKYNYSGIRTGFSRSADNAGNNPDILISVEPIKDDMAFYDILLGVQLAKMFKANLTIQRGDKTLLGASHEEIRKIGTDLVTTDPGFADLVHTYWMGRKTTGPAMRE